MPAYLITYPDAKKPRAIEIKNPRRARQHAAKSFEVRKLDAREIFDLAKQGIELEVVEKAAAE